MKITYTLKKYLLIMLVTTLGIASYSQSNECGFKYTEEAKLYFDSIKDEIKTLENKFIQQRLASTSTVLNSVPIKAHIIRRTDGTGGLTTAELDDAISVMNSIYTDAGLEFFLCDGINFIDSDDYFNYETSEESALFAAHSQSNIMNIYFANSVQNSTSGSNVCGYARFPGTAITENILMANSCTTNGSTLSHEVGHFFSLSHTHGNSNTPGSTAELVDGSNCSTTGDFICDTPADPQLSYGNVSSISCVYSGNTQDANNDIYVPDPNNLMSYSPKECRNIFSLQQLARINAVYQTSRNNLTCPTFNADFTADETESCATGLTVNFSDNSIGATSWSWDVNGDDIVDYTSQNVTHTYNNLGEYDVALTISDGTKNISKVKSNYIDIGGAEITTSTIELNLTLDDYPNETDWQFIDENNNVVANGGSYNTPNTTITEIINIGADTCYSFIISDTYGDGICCNFGSGQYEIRDDNGILLASGGLFGFETSDNFRGASVLNLDKFKTSKISLFPNPSSDVLNIQSEYTPDSYSIISTLGQVLKTSKVDSNSEFSVDISEFKSGLYFIKLNKNNSSQTLSFVKN